MKKLLCLGVVLVLPIALGPSARADGEAGGGEIGLFELEEFLERQVSIASRQSESIEKAPGVITVITAEQIRDWGARDLSDVLRRVPGVAIQKDIFGATQFVFRGFLGTSESNHVLLMIDGVPMNVPYYGGASLAYDDLLLENVRQIEIIRGPGSALYGANAFAGVINVVTKSGSDVQGLQVAGSGGSFSTARGGILFGRKWSDKADLMISFDALKTDGPSIRIAQDAYTGYLDVNGLPVSSAPGDVPAGKKKYDFSIKATLGDITLQGDYMRNRRGVYVGNWFTVQDTEYYIQTESFEQIAYKKSFLEDDFLTVHAAIRANQHQEHEVQQTYPQRAFDADGDGDIEDFTPWKPLDEGDLASDSVSLLNQYDLRFTKRHQLTLGWGYEWINQTDTYFVDSYTDSDGDVPDYVFPFNTSVLRSQYNLFAQDDFTAYHEEDRRLRVVLGLRYDNAKDDPGRKDVFRYGRDFEAVSPRAALVFEPTKDLSLKLLYGRAFRAPSFRELYSDDAKTVQGGFTLDPEYVNTYELAADLRRGDRFGLRASLYEADAKDLLVTRRLPDGGIVFGNLGRFQSRGLEVEAYVAPVKELILSANYTYDDARDQDLDTRLAGIAKHKANLGASYSRKHFAGNLNVSYVGDRRQPDEGPEDRPLKAYTFVEASFRILGLAEGLSIELTGHNLLDTDFEDAFDGSEVPGELPGEGISAYAALRYKFSLK